MVNICNNLDHNFNLTQCFSFEAFKKSVKDHLLALLYILGLNRMVSGICICLARFKRHISHIASEFNANMKNILFLLIFLRFSLCSSC